MAFRSARDDASDSDDAESKSSFSTRQSTSSGRNASGGTGKRRRLEGVEARYGPDAYPKSLTKGLYRQAKKYGPDRVGEWADEGMPTDVMGKPRGIESFHERQENRPPEVPTHIEQTNEASVHRSKKAQQDTDPAGDIGIPGSVRDVISSPGKNLDGEVRSGLEDRLGSSLDHVQIHTGPRAQQACEEVNARAFAVGNHIAFGPGEYDPSSPEGQHLIAHEVVHTLQQPDAEMSMMPKADLDVEIDPDPKAEREADEIAGEVMKGGEVGMTKSWQADVHVQRAEKTRRELITGDVTTTELAAGIEEATILSVDPDSFRDAYKFAEHAVTLGGTQAVVQPLVSEFGLSQPEAMAVTLAVGGSIHVGKDRLHREDIYLTLEVGRLLGVEDRVMTFFEGMDVDLTGEGEDPYKGDE